MIQDIIAERYARALFALCREQNQIDAIEREISALAEMAFSSEKYHSYWENPMVDMDNKIQLLESIFGIFQVTPLSDNFLRLLIRKRRFGLLPIIVEKFRLLVQEAHGVANVTVVTAVEPDAQAVEQIRGLLAQKLSREINVTTEVDASLLGGMIVRMGNKVVDGSVKNQLQRLQERIERGATQ